MSVYVATEVGFEPATLRTQGAELTCRLTAAPPRSIIVRLRPRPTTPLLERPGVFRRLRISAWSHWIGLEVRRAIYSPEAVSQSEGRYLRLLVRSQSPQISR